MSKPIPASPRTNAPANTRQAPAADISFQPLPSVAKATRTARVDLPPGVREALNFLDTSLLEFDSASLHQIDEVIAVCNKLKENQSNLEACLRAHARSKVPHHFVSTLRHWLCSLSDVLKTHPQLLQACTRSELETMALGLTACISLGHNNLFSTASRKAERDAFFSLAGAVFENILEAHGDQNDHAGCDCNLHNLVSRLLKSGLLSGKDAPETTLRTLMKNMSAHYFASLSTWRGTPDAGLSGLLSSSELRAGNYDNHDRMVKRAGKAMVQLETLCDSTHALMPLGEDDKGRANRAELIQDLAWLGGAKAIAAYARDTVNGQVALSSLAHLHACLLKWGYLSRDASTRQLLAPLLEEIVKLAAPTAAQDSNQDKRLDARSLANFCGLLKELLHRKQDALWDADSRPFLESACQAVAGVLADLGSGKLDTATAVPMFAFLRALEAWQARPARTAHGQHVTTTSTTSNATVTTTTSTTSSLSRAGTSPSTTTATAGLTYSNMTATQFAQVLEHAAAALLRRLPSQALGAEHQREHQGTMRDILKWLQGKPALAASASACLDELELIASGKAPARGSPGPASAPQVKPLLLAPREEKVAKAAPKQERWAGGIVGAGALQKSAPMVQAASSALQTVSRKASVQRDQEHDDWYQGCEKQDPADIQFLTQPGAPLRKAVDKAKPSGSGSHTNKPSTVAVKAKEKREHGRSSQAGRNRKHAQASFKNFDDELAWLASPAKDGSLPPFDVKDFALKNSTMAGPACNAFPAALNRSLQLMVSGRMAKKESAATLEKLRALVSEGNPAALYWLGLLQLEGKSMPASREGARTHLGTAAKAGLSHARYALALIYKAEGDWMRYQKCLAKAAAQEHPNALKESEAFAASQTLPADLQAAVKTMMDNYKRNSVDAAFNARLLDMLHAAADAGNAAAWHTLGEYYLQGRLGKKDFALARDCLLKAGELGIAQAYSDLAQVFREGPHKNYGEYIRNLQAAAELAHAPSCATLGLEYERGIKVEQNLELAARWYEFGASLGSAQAQWHMGLCFLEAKGVEHDEPRAMEYLQDAAAQAYPEAALKLSYLNVLKQNHSLALVSREQFSMLEKAGQELLDDDMRKLMSRLERGVLTGDALASLRAALVKLADQGNASALYQLGLLHEAGALVDAGLIEKDEDKALDLIDMAAGKGLPAAMFDAACRYQKKGDETMAGYWLPIAANMGHGQACLALGRKFEQEHADGQRDCLELAFHYWVLGAAQGDADCQRAAAQCWLEGRGTGVNGRNLQKGEALLAAAGAQEKATLAVSSETRSESAQACPAKVKIAVSTIENPQTPQRRRVEACHTLLVEAQAASAWAQYELGRIHFEGKYVQKDLEKAALWLQQAEGRGPVRASYYLGELYNTGTSLTPFSRERALLGWHEGAAQGDAFCEYRLGVACFLGNDGMLKNEAQAIVMFERAREHGHPDAARMLEQIRGATS